jgi:predicted dehydrogenase
MSNRLPKERPLNVALVGLGYWGPNLLRVLVENADVQVKWMCDLDPERLTRYSRRYPGTGTTLEVDEVFADPSVDAVFLATPVFTHFNLAAASLAAGKHTFVEKPLAPSLALADELIALADRNGRTLMCGHTFVYSPAVRAVKRMLDAGELGKTFFITSSRVNLGLHQRDVSVVWDLGPHDFSILRYWLDETPVTMNAVGRDSIVPGIPDVAFVTMTFPSGLVANAELSEKMIVYTDGSTEPIRVYNHGVVYHDPEDFGQYHLSYRTGEIVSPKVDTYEPLVAELGDFLDAVRRGDRLDWQLALARDVVSMTETADRSLQPVTPRELVGQTGIGRRFVRSDADVDTDALRPTAA